MGEEGQVGSKDKNPQGLKIREKGKKENSKGSSDLDHFLAAT